MPEYRYQAQDSKGANVRGKMNAVDEADLQKKLHNQGVMLLEAKPSKKKKPVKSTVIRINQII